jgi:hypothetical protein
LDLKQGAGEICIMKSFKIFTLYQTFLWSSIKEDEIGRTYSKHEGDQNFLKTLVRNPEGERLLGGWGVDGTIILK